MPVKWCYIGPERAQYNQEHLNLLSSELKKHDIENVGQMIQTDIDKFGSELKNAFEVYSLIRVDPAFLENVVENLAHTVVDVSNINSVDSIGRNTKNVWWPRGYLKTAFNHFISEKCKNIGVVFPALVIGANGVSRAAVASLVHIGFNQIVLVDDDEVRAKNEIEDLKKVFFDVKFEIAKKEKLTLLPGIHSLVINTLSVLSNKELFYELYYCNYLKKGAAVIDLNLYPLVTPLLRLSEGIGGSVFSGFEFWAYHDMEWCKGEFNIALDKNSYSTKLKEIYSKIPFDETTVFDSKF